MEHRWEDQKVLPASSASSLPGTGYGDPGGLQDGDVQLRIKVFDLAFTCVHHVHHIINGNTAKKIKN